MCGTQIISSNRFGPRDGNRLGTICLRAPEPTDNVCALNRYLGVLKKYTVALDILSMLSMMSEQA